MYSSTSPKNGAGKGNEEKVCYLSAGLMTIAIIGIAAVIYTYLIMPGPSSKLHNSSNKDLPMPSKVVLNGLSYTALFVGILALVVSRSSDATEGFVYGSILGAVITVFFASMLALLERSAKYIISKESFGAVVWWTLAIGVAGAASTYASKNWIIIK